MPEVQNSNALSDWIDRTFGFTGPQQVDCLLFPARGARQPGPHRSDAAAHHAQRGGEAPQYDAMEYVEEEAGVQGEYQDQAPERVFTGAAAYNAYNAQTYFDASENGSASWSVPYVKPPPAGAAPLASMHM